MTSPSLGLIPNPLHDLQTSPAKIWLSPSPLVSALSPPGVITLQLLAPCLPSPPECECGKGHVDLAVLAPGCSARATHRTRYIKAATETGGGELGFERQVNTGSNPGSATNQPWDLGQGT